MATSTAPAAKPVKTWMGHPGGLVVLFLTEMWERFSFYGMRAILTLFLAASATVGGFGMTAASAAVLYSIYNSMVYFMALPGGWIADRLIGTRRSVLYGGIVIALGHYALAAGSKAMFYLGLVLIVLGTGLLKPNISAMVGELYDKHPEMHESRRDAGFTLFYLGINLGAFIAPLLTGYFAAKNDWHLAFGIAAVGMTLAVIQYIFGHRRLEGVGLKAHKPLLSHERSRLLKIAAVVVAVVAVLLIADVAAGTFKADHVINALTLMALVVPAAYFLMMFRDRSLTTQERSRVSAYVWIFIGAALFWMIYDQAGSLVNLFTETDVDRQVGSFEIPTAWFQSINPVLILLLAPLFAWTWTRLDRRQPGTPVKFSWALLGIGLSFLVMGAAGAAAGRGLISPWWIVLVYFIQTCAELLLSPVGLSVTTKLAPLRYASQVMGLWFLASSAGNALNTWVTPLAEKLPAGVYYGGLGLLAIAVGICFWFGSRRIGRLMHGVH
ncbi:peptide MFS transporter [Catellatospora sp. KI3]|uniref:peptide MFS transporter n=1 Tax=Catellatospora sp. KI3 TaxID=3041620 RepID=UPI0024829EED|nr:peptide MFS transporter [Catellatospora sp. KI3]MDI1463620.1 peptide MFS transporter [Catellatospora sp. KI3]